MNRRSRILCGAVGELFGRLLPLLLVIGGVAICQAEEFEVINAKVSNGYARTVLPNGAVLPEFYVIREGGYLSGRVADASIDKISFADVVASIQPSLASRKYLPADASNPPTEVILVYWGTSRAGAGHATGSDGGHGLEPPSRPLSESKSTVMSTLSSGFGPIGPLSPQGVDGNLTQLRDIEARGTGWADQMVREEDAMQMGYESGSDPDLRKYRYFVVLLDYDLVSLGHRGKEKLLWQARFSVEQVSRRFDRALRTMAFSASPFYGQDTHGLVRSAYPEGRVEIGEIRTVDEAGAGEIATLAPDGAHVAWVRSENFRLTGRIVGIEKPDQAASFDVRTAGGGSPRIEWADRERLVVSLSDGERFGFDTRGRALDSAAVGAGPAAAALSQALPLSQIEEASREKFPHRDVAVLDRAAADRVLVEVTGPGVPARYFVWDSRADVLYFVGRAGDLK